jgi:hypothetical protein
MDKCLSSLLGPPFQKRPVTANMPVIITIRVKTVDLIIHTQSYLHLSARCDAIQLDYTLAHKQLSQALLKAPHESLAVGFRQSVRS